MNGTSYLRIYAYIIVAFAALSIVFLAIDFLVMHTTKFYISTNHHQGNQGQGIEVYYRGVLVSSPLAKNTGVFNCIMQYPCECAYAAIVLSTLILVYMFSRLVLASYKDQFKAHVD